MKRENLCHYFHYQYYLYTSVVYVARGMRILSPKEVPNLKGRHQQTATEGGTYGKILWWDE